MKRKGKKLREINIYLYTEQKKKKKRKGFCTTEQPHTPSAYILLYILNYYILY